MSQTGLARRQQAFVHCNSLLLGAALVSAGSCELLQAISQKLLLASEMTPDVFSVHLEYSWPSESQPPEYLSAYC